MKSALSLFGAVSGALILIGGISYAVVQGLQNSPDTPHPASLSALTPPTVPPITSFTLPDTSGVNQALGQWRGKVLVVNFWATWCPPCREEMPEFSRLSVKYAAKNVQFVGISIDTLNNVLNFQKTNPVKYPLLIGTMDSVQSTVPLGNSAQGLPFTAIFDQAGKLHSVKLGKLSEDDLEHRLQELTGATGQQ